MTDKILIDRSVVEQAIAALTDLAGWRAAPLCDLLRAALEQPQRGHEPLVAELQDTFFEGFCAVETYNDIRLNSVEEEWEKYKTAHGIKEQK